jgi:hypothetical protein
MRPLIGVYHKGDGYSYIQIQIDDAHVNSCQIERAKVRSDLYNRAGATWLGAPTENTNSSKPRPDRQNDHQYHQVTQLPIYHTT